MQDFGVICELRDITQVYIQLKNKLTRDIFVYLFFKLKNKYFLGIILWIVQPLYNLAESGLY
jgi:hypothetical protein